MQQTCIQEPHQLQVRWKAEATPMDAAVVSTGPPGEGLLASAGGGLGSGPSADLGFVQQVSSFL